jgi:ElaB/YqjD/DUF883 family membrane-anchored ribosome-binding protein
MATTPRNLESEFDTLKQDLATLRADIGSLVGVLKDEGAAKLNAAAAQAGVAAGKAVDLGKQGVSELETTIAQRPLSSVLIAFGVGAIIGRITLR